MTQAAGVSRGSSSEPSLVSYLVNRLSESTKQIFLGLLREVPVKCVDSIPGTEAAYHL